MSTTNQCSAAGFLGGIALLFLMIISGVNIPVITGGLLLLMII